MRVKIQTISEYATFKFCEGEYKVINNTVDDDEGYLVDIDMVKKCPDLYRIEYLDEKKNILMLDEDKIPSLITKSELEQYLVDHLHKYDESFSFVDGREYTQFYLVTDSGLELLDPTNLEVVYKAEVKL